MPGRADDLNASAHGIHAALQLAAVRCARDRQLQHPCHCGCCDDDHTRRGPPQPRAPEGSWRGKWRAHV
jgi:hypothetical protein